MYSLIIVEDDDSIRSGLVHLFPWEDCGFTIAGDFSNGKNAWKFLQEHSEINAVLTDVQMPVMDGLELAKLIYEQMPATAVFLISGFQEFSYAQRAIQYNVRDFLIKPVRHQTLMLTFLKWKEELDKAGMSDGQNIETAPGNQYYEQMIRMVKAYVTDNLKTASLEEAAVMTHLSSSYLSRLFKSQCDLSFSDFLLKKRMEQACVLLSDPRNKIYEVSDAIGYDNPKNFSRAFRSYYHQSPKDFREKGSQNENEA